MNYNCVFMLHLYTLRCKPLVIVCEQ